MKPTTMALAALPDDAQPSAAIPAGAVSARGLASYVMHDAGMIATITSAENNRDRFRASPYVQARLGRAIRKNSAIPLSDSPVAVRTDRRARVAA